MATPAAYGVPTTPGSDGSYDSAIPGNTSSGLFGSKMFPNIGSIILAQHTNAVFGARRTLAVARGAFGPAEPLLTPYSPILSSLPIGTRTLVMGTGGLSRYGLVGAHRFNPLTAIPKLALSALDLLTENVAPGGTRQWNFRRGGLVGGVGAGALFKYDPDSIVKGLGADVVRAQFSARSTERLSKIAGIENAEQLAAFDSRFQTARDRISGRWRRRAEYISRTPNVPEGVASRSASNIGRIEKALVERGRAALSAEATPAALMRTEAALPGIASALSATGADAASLLGTRMAARLSNVLNPEVQRRLTSILPGRGTNFFGFTPVSRANQFVSRAVGLQHLGIGVSAVEETAMRGAITSAVFGKLTKSGKYYRGGLVTKAYWTRHLLSVSTAVMAASLLGGGVLKVAEFARNAITQLNEKFESARGLEIGTGLFLPAMTGQATTERRRALAAIQESRLNARTLIGNEAVLAHR